MSVTPQLIARLARRGIDVKAAAAPKESVLDRADSIATQVAIGLLAKQREESTKHQACVAETRKAFSLLTLDPLKARQNEIEGKVSGDEGFVAALRDVAASDAHEAEKLTKPLADHEALLLALGPKRIK
jgi:hypothetical protein